MHLDNVVKMLIEGKTGMVCDEAIHNNIVKINFEDVNSFDWNGLGSEINNLAKSKYPLMFALEKADMRTVREISFKGSVVEFALLFMFIFNEEAYQVVVPSIYQWVTNEIILIDINDILDEAYKEVNSIIRRAMEDMENEDGQ